MPSSTLNVPQAHSRLPLRLPVSRAMLSLLSSLVRAIDTRSAILDDAQEEDWEPETCDTCGGVGFILIPSTVQGNIDDNDVDDAVPIPPPAPLAPKASVAIQAPLVESTGTSESATTPTGLVQDSECAPPTTDPLTSTSTSSVPDGAGAIDPTAAPTGVPLSGGPVPVTVTATPLPQPIINLPPASAPIPGFNPLGPNTAVPHPTNAVYCGAGADRYYCVTKGIRVGVYSGWQNTSPYVTGVASASYSRHRTIHAAYDAYCSAYYAGFVSYA